MLRNSMVGDGRFSSQIFHAHLMRDELSEIVYLREGWLLVLMVMEKLLIGDGAVWWEFVLNIILILFSCDGRLIVGDVTHPRRIFSCSCDGR